MKLDCYGCDVTSGLPEDITVTMVTLTMGHGQMVTSGLLDDITKQVHHIWVTDATMRMVALAA